LTLDYLKDYLCIKINMSSSNKSLYEILGVNKSDSCNEIKKAYLKLARTHHPDKGGDPENFKEILRASEVLTDEKKRKMYDEFGVIDGENGQGPSGMPFQNNNSGFPFPFEINLNDLFGGMFGNPPVGPNKGPIRKGKKPAPAIQTINVTLEQFYLGHNFDININRSCFCTSCDHSGAKSKETCKNCNGRGAISQVVQMGPMAMHTTGPCIDCQGKGEKIIIKCDKCSGTGFTQEKRNLSVKITPGTITGETYIFPEVCSDHPAFERPGDAHIVITEDPNDPAFKYFKRVGDKLQNLETSISISLSEALIGCVVQIDGHPAYDEGLFIKIPAGSFQGDKYCLSGFGMPIPGNIGKYGDMYVNINMNISPNERNLLANQGRDILKPLFEDKIRHCNCSEESIQTGLYLKRD
jgi:molecular chaperone DnaJ